MKRKIERIAKAAAIAGIAMLLLSSLVAAETARQKVVKEACYALDGGQDYICGETTKIGNWDYVFALRFRINKNNPRKAVFLLCDFSL